MGANKYEFQPIRENITILSAACLFAAWGIYWLGGSRDMVSGCFESSLILIIAAEAFARD